MTASFGVSRDATCGSGGRFVQSGKFGESRGDKLRFDSDNALKFSHNQMPAPTNNSGLRDNRIRGTVADFLRTKTQGGLKLSIFSTYVTVYAYDALKDARCVTLRSKRGNR